MLPVGVFTSIHVRPEIISFRLAGLQVCVANGSRPWSILHITVGHCISISSE
jgi:hypothetical protein